jgi:hypothetical protein
VRRKIHELDKARIWTAEDSGRTDLGQRRGAAPFYIVDELIVQIRRSNLFICVLRDVYGTSVFGETESVSFLETVTVTVHFIKTQLIKSAHCRRKSRSVVVVPSPLREKASAQTPRFPIRDSRYISISRPISRFFTECVSAPDDR